MGQDAPDVRANRLSPAAYAENFDDAKPPLDAKQALIEASRCYFCYDAPCIAACPTGIDIPNFIRKIATGNLKGSAMDILSANIMGGACARVCPTEVLCEEACVRNGSEAKPVRIGALQRHSTDWLFAQGAQPFTRQKATGKRVAVVGGGPAGLSCAHRLAMAGHEVTVFEAHDRLGGLNEYGIAAYKVPHGFAQREVDFILGIGGIAVECNKALGRDIKLSDLRKQHDAVFLGMGLSGVNALKAEGEALEGVEDAVAYIARLRQAKDLGVLPVGRKVVVIGGGNTAIDIAVQSKRLGAEDVTIVYRRGPQQMSATGHEQDFAQTNGVKIKHWARPVRAIGWAGNGARRRLKEVEFEYTQLDEAGRLMGTGDKFTLLADTLFKAIGQAFVPDPLKAGSNEMLQLKDGRIAVNDDRQTSLPGVFAGGDCAAGGQDLTVQAVQDGKIAAAAIDRYLRM
jgi:glutamate synthase (NADPH/NADH) small chain